MNPSLPNLKELTVTSIKNRQNDLYIRKVWRKWLLYYFQRGHTQTSTSSRRDLLYFIKITVDKIEQLITELDVSYDYICCANAVDLLNVNEPRSLGTCLSKVGQDDYKGCLLTKNPLERITDMWSTAYANDFKIKSR